MSSSRASEEPVEKYTNNAASIDTCPLCKMFLQKPAQIPCGHSYCVPCVSWLLRNILDPECLICGKKIVTDDDILNFGSIKPDETKRKEIERIIAKGMNKNVLHLGQSDPCKDDPLLLNLSRWEHSFPKHFVPHSLALGFRHPICDADVRRGVTRALEECFGRVPGGHSSHSQSSLQSIKNGNKQLRIFQFRSGSVYVKRNRSITTSTSISS